MTNLREACEKYLDKVAEKDGRDSHEFFAGYTAALDLLWPSVAFVERVTCDCSIAERLSGHLIGCGQIELDNVLEELKSKLSGEG